MPLTEYHMFQGELKRKVAKTVIDHNVGPIGIEPVV